MTSRGRGPVVAGVAVLVTTTAHALVHAGTGTGPGDPRALAAGALLGFAVVCVAHRAVARRPMPPAALVVVLLFAQAAVHVCHEVATDLVVPAGPAGGAALHRHHHHGAADLAASSPTAAWLITGLHAWAAAVHLVLVCGGQRCLRAAGVAVVRAVAALAVLARNAAPVPTGPPPAAPVPAHLRPSPVRMPWLLGAGALTRRGPPTVAATV
jgi:hypothetical protein